MKAFGLDISDFSMKAAQIVKRGKLYALISYCKVNFYEPHIEAGEIRDKEAVVGLIKKTVLSCRSKPISCKNVVASIPESKSFVRIIEIPPMPAEEVKEAVPWEAEQHIPLPLEQVYLDWQVLVSEKKNLQKSNIKVLLAATPKDIVDSYIEVIEKAGLNPVALELESQATVRSLVGEEKSDEALLIADIGAKTTSFIVYDKGVIQFTASIPVAGLVFTKTIANRLGLSFQDAESTKISEGLSTEKNIKALNSVLLNLIEEIKTLISFYENHYPKNNKIKRILLCGGGAGLIGLNQYIEKGLKIKTEMANPWKRLEKSWHRKVSPIPQNEILEYTTALGLALRGAELDLYKEDGIK